MEAITLRGDRPTQQVSRESFLAVMQLLAEHPEVTPEGLRQLVEQQGRRRPRAEPIRPRTAGEVVQLLGAKVITRAEARRFLRLK